MTAPEDGCSEGSADSAPGAAMVTGDAVASSVPAAGSEELWSASGTVGEGGVSSSSPVKEKSVCLTFWVHRNVGLLLH